MLEKGKTVMFDIETGGLGNQMDFDYIVNPFQKVKNYKLLLII